MVRQVPETPRGPDPRLAAVAGQPEPYRNGALLGVMVSGLSGDLVWAVDMASGCTSVRVARKLSPPL